MPRQHDRAGQVHPDLIGDRVVVDRIVQQIDPLHDPGIVDQHIQAAVALPDRRGKGQHVVADRYVATDGLDAGVAVLQLPQCHLAAPARDHVGAFPRQAFDECSSDPRAAAAHHDDTAGPILGTRICDRHWLRLEDEATEIRRV